MDRVERKLQKVIYTFIVSVIIIVAAFAVTIYYYETKETSRAAAVEGLFVKAFVDESVGAVPLNVSFSPLLFNFEGTPTYHWDFGDGNTSDEINPTHSYTEEGEYTCNLTVTDTTGETVTTSVKIMAMANRAPTVVVSVEPPGSPRPNTLWLVFIEKIPTIGQRILVDLAKSDSPLAKEKGKIICEAQVDDPEGDEIVSYEWELTQPILTKLGGEQEWPKFPFEGKNLTTITLPMLCTFRKGQYDIKVTVTDAAGNKASDIKRFNIEKSQLESKKDSLKGIWDQFWMIKFEQKPAFMQELATKIVWGLLGPTQTITDTIVYTIVDRLPGNIGALILQTYNIWWEQKERLYRKPNYYSPNMPSDPSPADNSTGVDLDADLSWNCSDPDGHKLMYYVYFGETTPPPLSRLDYENTTYPLVTLKPNTTYYWQIVARDKPITGKPRTTDGPLWSFTTGTG